MGLFWERAEPAVKSVDCETAFYKNGRSTCQFELAKG